MHAMLVVSFPNSTAIMAAKAQKSALDFPESLTKMFDFLLIGYLVAPQRNIQARRCSWLVLVSVDLMDSSQDSLRDLLSLSLCLSLTLFLSLCIYLFLSLCLSMCLSSYLSLSLCIPALGSPQLPRDRCCSLRPSFLPVSSPPYLLQIDAEQKQHRDILFWLNVLPV